MIEPCKVRLKNALGVFYIFAGLELSVGLATSDATNRKAKPKSCPFLK